VTKSPIVNHRVVKDLILAQCFTRHIFTRKDAHFHALQHIQNLFWFLRMLGANMVLKGGKTYESRRKTRGYL